LKDLEATEQGVQLMKPITNLTAVIQDKGKGIFGTKMRSVIFDDNQTEFRKL
jgi:fructose-bisphosphate aldolase class I